ncbi:twin-arginine translocase subunit TatC [Verrucomicrobiaceae bacterium N1E253]|uniref:Sec-independent protein translocase protein TatC n=1 Tax=Oceaniferula marina TaxID=2748318 RepID=A0A851GS42_9BACT|nr:twin-arginine translocase subunit TatC [Oceaniferula marina]NWK57054.1 twin-arginine translocase subunit TatC [Oceaniferula marina]
MFVLKKLFELRDKTHESDEKPFLDHLEDLRIVITRVVLTLTLSMLVCFIFRNELMEIIRKPVEQTWHTSQKSKMPGPEDAPVALELETWEKAKRAARDTARFSEPQKNHYFKYQDPDGSLKLEFHSGCVIYYQAAIDMENTTQNGVGFIKDLPDIDEDTRKQVTALLDEEKRPDAAVDSRGKLVLMQALNPTEGFMLSMKLALFAGIIVSFPLLLYFILQFILPGLKQNEKKALWPALLIGFGLFTGGVLFSYFFVLPKVLDFFYNWSQEMGVTNEWRIGYYISFATQFTLIFGLSFELPVVVMTLVKLGILNYDMMRNTRSYAILAIVIIAALITPTPDAFTLLLLAGPMIVLYEICIWLAFFHGKKEREKERAEQEELKRKLASAPALATSRDGDDDPEDPEDDPDGSEGSDAYNSYDDEFSDDHYHYSDEDPYEIHGDDEGNEEDTGTYDFPEENEDVSHEDPPLDHHELTDEYHPYYDNLDEAGTKDLSDIDFTDQEDNHEPEEESDKETDEAHPDKEKSNGDTPSDDKEPQ